MSHKDHVSGGILTLAPPPSSAQRHVFGKAKQTARKFPLQRVREVMACCLWDDDEIYRDHFKPVRAARICRCNSESNAQSAFRTDHNHESCRQGTYLCSQCGYELFPSKAKFKHSSPWVCVAIHKYSLNNMLSRSQPSRPRATRTV